MKTLQDYIDKLNKLNFKEMHNNDFQLGQNRRRTGRWVSPLLMLSVS